MLNVKNFFLSRILTETKKTLFPLLLRKLLLIFSLLPICIFIPLVLRYYLSLMQGAVKVFALCLGNILFLPFSFG